MRVRGKKADLKKVEDALKILREISNDVRVPKNIKEAVNKAIESLEDKKRDVYVRVDAAIHFLDEVADDINMDMYTRTQIWNVISILGSI